MEVLIISSIASPLKHHPPVRRIRECGSPGPAPLSLEHCSRFQAQLESNRYEISDVSFPSLFMWRHAFEARVCEAPGALCVFCRRHESMFALPPLGPTEVLAGALVHVYDYFRSLGQPFHMKAVPEWMVPIAQDTLGKPLKVSSDPANWDYIYRTEDLIHLPGRKYQSRRNHLNQFLNHYAYEYLPLTPAIVEECLAVDRRWRQNRHDSELLAEEERAVQEALTHMTELQLTGGALRVNGRISAFTVGAMLTADMAVVHIEKADTDIPGLYAAINQLAAENAWSHTRLINREEDMGLSGLRQAKRAYQPVHMVKKFEISAE